MSFLFKKKKPEGSKTTDLAKYAKNPELFEEYAK